MYVNMRQCDSKSLQDARKMCFWRDSQYSMLRREQSPLFNTYIRMTLIQKREEVESSVQICAKSISGSPPLKPRIFMACTFFPSAKLDIVIKVVDKTLFPTSSTEIDRNATLRLLVCVLKTFKTKKQ